MEIIKIIYKKEGSNLKEYQGVKIAVCWLNQEDIITASSVVNFDVNWLNSTEEGWAE